MSKKIKGHLYIENLDLEVPFSNEKSILEVLNKQNQIKEAEQRMNKTKKE